MLPSLLMVIPQLTTPLPTLISGQSLANQMPDTPSQQPLMTHLIMLLARPLPLPPADKLFS